MYYLVRVRLGGISRDFPLNFKVQIPSPIVTPENDLSRLIDGLLYLELKKENFRKCKYNPDPRELPPLIQLIRSSCQMDIADKLGVRIFLCCCP